MLQRRFSGTKKEEEEEGEGEVFETQKVEFANIQYTQDTLYRLCHNLVRLRRQFLEQGSKLDADLKKKEFIRFRYEKLCKVIHAWLMRANFDGYALHHKSNSPEKSVRLLVEGVSRERVSD